MISAKHEEGTAKYGYESLQKAYNELKGKYVLIDQQLCNSRDDLEQVT